MCLGRDEEAVDQVLAQLADPEHGDSAIEELQPQAMELFYTRSILPHPRDILMRDERLLAAFLRAGRLVPEQYHPAASLKRQ